MNKNKGLGAGGANTNKSGLLFEEQTDLSSEYTIIEINDNHSVIKFNSSDKEI